MSSTSPWASSATPRACERRCGGARGAPTPRPSPLQLCRGPSTPAPRPAPRILRHQPGHRAIRLPSPPTAAWDKGTLGGVLRAPLFPAAAAGAPAGLGPGSSPAPEPQQGLLSRAPCPPWPCLSHAPHPPAATASKAKPRPCPGCRGGHPHVHIPPLNQPCPRVLPAGGTAWGQLGFFFTRFYFF